MPVQLIPHPDALEFLAQMNILAAGQTVNNFQQSCKKVLLNISGLKMKNLNSFVTVDCISGSAIIF